MRSSISRMVSHQGDQLIRATPTAIVISLISAALLPHVLALAGGEHAVSTAVAMAGPLKLLGDLGLAATAGFIPGLVDRLREKSRGRKTPTEEEIRQQLEKELLDQWHAGGQSAAALRQEASRLLQAIQGVEAALAGATGDVRQALAQGLAELGGNFDEFRWILDELKTTLAEIRNEQAVQLALQKEQLGLQREQLVKTNLLLRLQQSTAPLQTTVSPAVTGFEEEIPPAEVPCPYKGLASFEPEDADYFFGREELVAELNTRLAETRFLAVVGPSGSGKSSVVRAGLMPAIWRGEIPGSQHWKTILLSPGQHPLEELVIRIGLLTGVAPGSLLHDLETDERGLHLAVRQALAQEPDHVRLVLVVDQFEELFALCQDENERRHFIEVLLRACQSSDSRMTLVLAIRADFYGRCATYPALASSLQDNQVLVGPLSEVELCQAIEQPAARVGLTLEPGLVETILTDIGGSPGALPLLSHALLETWNRRRGYTLTIHGYLESGGVEGSIARTADRVYEERLSPDQQAVARDIFLRLTAIGEGTLETRRRAKREELFPRAEDRSAVEVVLKTLVDARLVTASEDTVEVAHEALIRQWPRLRKWLEEDREGLRLHRHLTEAADEWVRLDRDPGSLYRGARLAAASEWARDHTRRLNPLEREFLESSQALEVNELKVERKRSARLRRRGLYLAGALIIALGLAVAAGYAALMYRASQLTLEAAGRTLVSRYLAQQSLLLLDDEPDLALLLSVEANLVEDSLETRGALLEVSQHRPALVGVLPGQGAAVRELAYSPDGKLLAVGTDDPNIRVWDLATRQSYWDIVQPFRIGSTQYGVASLRSLAFNADGTKLAAGFGGGCIFVWDVRDDAHAAEQLGCHENTLSALAFSPQGGQLASASLNDSEIRLWDFTTHNFRPLIGHTNTIFTLAFSSDRNVLASASYDGTIRLWDTTTGEALGNPLADAMFPVAADFSGGGQLISVDGHGGVTVRHWESGTVNGQIPPQRAASAEHGLVDINSDAGLVALGYGGGETYVVDVRAGRWTTVADLSGNLSDLRFSPDNQTIATGDLLGNVYLWALEASDLMARRFSPLDLGADYYIGEGYDSIQDVTFSGGGATLAIGQAYDDSILEGGALLWDVDVHPSRPQIVSGGELHIQALRFSPDGKLLAGFADRLLVWDLSEDPPQVLGRSRTGINDVIGVAWSPDGKKLAWSNSDGAVQMWDVQANVVIGLPIEERDRPALALAFSPDNDNLAWGSEGGRVTVWDLQAHKVRSELSTTYAVGVVSVVFSPDGSRLACGDSNGVVTVWDLNMNQSVGTPLSRYHAGIVGLAFSPDGGTLASASEDSVITFWDMSSSAAVYDVLIGRPLSRIAFSPDGETLVAWDSDSAAFFPLDPATWREKACLRAGRNLTIDEWNRYVTGQGYRRTCPEFP